MGLIITILSLLIALSILILVHEFGHLIAAKRSRVVVEEFGMGYPPRLLTLWKSNGSIVIDGSRIVVPRDFSLPEGLKALSRVSFETEEDSKGRAVLSRIEPVAEGNSGELTGRIDLLDPGTKYSVNAVPFGGFTKMLGEEDPSYPGSLASKSKLTRIVVLAAGSTMNLLLAIVFFALALMVGAPTVASPENAVINSVSPGSPAEVAELKSGDLILFADDVEILTIESLQEHTQAHLGEPLVLTVQRGERILEITLVPRVEPPPGEGPIGIGLSPRITIERYPWHLAMWQGAKDTVTLVGFVITVPVQVLRGLIPADLARPVGPVGVGQIVGEAVQYSLDSGWWYPVMQMMGTLSVALAITNLLPLPGMDGGRILFVIIEGVRGRRLDPAKEGMVHLVGMMLLVALMLFITWQDVTNPLPALDWGSLF
ncbi:RIP metalloprotease [Chloroflexota bacterium]